MKAEVVRMFRNPYFIFWSLLMPIAFYIINTKIFLNNVPDQSTWETHTLMSMTVFSLMGSSMMNIGIRLVEERTYGWTLYLKVTPLKSSYYFSAKMAAQTLLNIFTILLIFSVGILVNGVSMSVFEWILCGAWILLGALPFMALGTLLGMMKKVETVSAVSNFTYLIMAIAGGLWIPMDFLPTIMQNIGKWLPSYHFGNGAWEVVWGNMPKIENIIILISYLAIFMVLSIYIQRKNEAVR